MWIGLLIKISAKSAIDQSLNKVRAFLGNRIYLYVLYVFYMFYVLSMTMSIRVSLLLDT